MSNWKIGKKLTLGMVVILILILIMGFVSINGISSISTFTTISDNQNRLVKYVLEARRAERILSLEKTLNTLIR